MAGHFEMVRIGRGFFTAALCGVLTMASLVSADESTQITLGVGTQKVIHVSGLKTLLQGNPQVVDTKSIGGDQLLFVGVGEGKANVTVIRQGGRQIVYSVTVRKQDPNEVIADVKKLLGDIEGITVHSVGDKIFVDGQAYTQSDADRIDQILTNYPNVKSLVKVAPNAKRLVATNLTTAFQKAGLKNVQANVVGTTLFLEGSVESAEDLKKAELLVKAIGEKVENLLTVGIKKMILAEVHFVEVSSNSATAFGIRWPTDISGTLGSNIDFSRVLIPPDSFASGLVGQAQMAAKFSISAIQDKGFGRVLAEPKLVCASGENAQFLAGGEIPIPIVTNNQLKVEYKEYGILLKIKPTADHNGNIQTEIEAEVSEIDKSAAVSIGSSFSIPGFKTRKVKTNVTVKHGETIVLSGLYANTETKDVAKIPGLGHLPIIGEFFKSRSFSDDKKELVIFVTPRIVSPESDRVQQMIDDMKTRYKEAKSDISFSIFD